MIRILKRLGHYMGGRKPLLPCSVVLSAVNGLLSLVPFIFLWLVVRTLLTADGNLADTPVWDYAIATFVVSVANVLLYFAASCSRIFPLSASKPICGALPWNG